jgi:hypothetical protein
MAKARLGWKLEGGYALLLNRTRLDVTMEEGPLRQQLKLTPFGLFREPTELIFRTRTGLKTVGPGPLQWRLKPGARIRAVILQPSNAYLGNFRIPKNHYGVQWDVEGEVTSEVSNRQAKVLMSAEVGSIVIHSWVILFAKEVPLISAVEESWRAFVNPFDPEQVQGLSERHVIRFRWRGKLSTTVGVSWGVGTGWHVGASKTLLRLQTAVAAKAGFKAVLSLSQSGSFVLRLSKRKGQIRLSIDRDRGFSGQTRFEVRATLKNSVEITPSWRGAKPLLEPLNDKLAEAVARRAEIAFTLESERWKRRHSLLKAFWMDPSEHSFIQDYQGIVSGRIPRARQGLKLSGRIETVRGKRLKIVLNILNWLRLGKSSEEKEYFRVEVGPRGEITIEEGHFVARTRYHWDELQLVSLLNSHRKSRQGSRKKFLWTFQLKKEFDRIELMRLLKKALHLRSIFSFDLPGPSKFPLTVDLSWYSEFSGSGIAQVRRSTREARWEALVASLELADPKLYARGSFARDWVVFSGVRSIIDENPIQSHLKSIYPKRGRSMLERKQVVATYLRVKSFLQLMELWEQEDQKRLMKSLDLGWELPIFYWFHLLCPASQRKSVVILKGDLEKVWGDPGIIED